MAFYADEEEAWKCPKHPSKRRRSGICPICLRDRLIALCPDCANVRPCACYATTAKNSFSSSSSSSFSLPSSSIADDSSRLAGVGTVGRLSNLIDSEPAFRRSRSIAVSFRRQKFPGDTFSGYSKPPPPSHHRKKSLFWTVFKAQKNEKSEKERQDGEAKKNDVVEAEEKNYAPGMMMRSKSVSLAVDVTTDSGAGDARLASVKSKSWYFPSPIKVFRHSKTSKVVQERSPLYRG